MRISPPPPGGPLLSLLLKPRPISESVSLVCASNASGCVLYDYTARCGAVRDEDRVTLRQTMFPDESDLKSFIVGKSYYEQEDVSSQMKKKGTEVRRVDADFGTQASPRPSPGSAQ